MDDYGEGPTDFKSSSGPRETAQGLNTRVFRRFLPDPPKRISALVAEYLAAMRHRRVDDGRQPTGYGIPIHAIADRPNSHSRSRTEVLVCIANAAAVLAEALRRR